MSQSLTRRSKLVLLCSVLVAATAPLGVAGATQDDDYEPDPSTAVGGPVAASLPTDPALFGVLPGTAPWVIDEGRFRVRSDGTLRLRVKGLVIPTAPANGTNPVLARLGEERRRRRLRRAAGALSAAAAALILAVVLWSGGASHQPAPPVADERPLRSLSEGSAARSA